MEYKDEDGKILYGYSQTDLEKNTKAVNKLSYLGWAFFLYIMGMTAYIMKNNVVNNIVASCL